MNFTTVVYRDSLNGAITKTTITVGLCISIIYVNCTLVHTVRKHQVFNMNPRYILYIHLVINDIITLTMFALLQILSYTMFTLNVSFCIVLIMIVILSNVNSPLTIAVMAVECYIAICFPLRHSQICTLKKTHAVITAIWVVSALTVVPDLFFTLATESMEFFSSKVFCLRDNVFRHPQLAMRTTTSNTVLLVFEWLILLYIYFRILLTAQTVSANAKKARNTILLHIFQLLLCTLNNLFIVILNGLTKLFPKDVVVIRYVISVLCQILLRLMNPIVYGIRDKMFRKYLKRYLLCKTNAKI